MKKIIAKKDLVLILVIVIAAAAVWIGYHLLNGGDGTQVRITVDGEEYGVYYLDEDQTIEIETDGVVTNTLVIEDGKADMIEANCPDGLCVNQRAISSGGETIVCLPNKIVVEVIADEDSEFDVVAQ